MPNKSSKSYVVVVSLSAVFGVLGIQHFYLGRWLEGICDVLLSLGTVYFLFVGNIPFALLFLLQT